MNIILDQTPQTIVADPITKTNEDAYRYWKDKIANLRESTPHSTTITFKYLTLKPQNFIAQMLFKKKLIEKEFTTLKVNSLTIFEKGWIVNDTPIKESVLWVGLSVKDEERFLVEQPFDNEGYRIFANYSLRRGNIIVIKFIDIVSVSM